VPNTEIGALACSPSATSLRARFIRIRGSVQGVGFRPFVFRLALANALKGWVLNGEDGVQIHVEGSEAALDAFVRELNEQAPPAAVIAGIEVTAAALAPFNTFDIRESRRIGPPTVRIAPDLPVCRECLTELFDPDDRRYAYPYINCTNCGPRYSIILGLPYDRQQTTLRRWPMCPSCATEYDDPANRRFHAQPVACPSCGPDYTLEGGDRQILRGREAITEGVRLLRAGQIVAIKGLGGYHLACDARRRHSVHALRERKYRKEKPFAVMVRDLEVARTIVSLDARAEALLTSLACPIVLAPARAELREIAPENPDLGVMLPYTPLHHLLFACGASEILVMTSGNRSSEPIAYEDDDALERLSGIADAFLVGDRPIARRLDDSVARAGAFGPVILRRSRGHAPGAVARLPIGCPVLAVGGDLKNTITLVVDGEAYVGQHIGDLECYPAYRAFQDTIEDFLSMYAVDREELVIVHDLHPQYVSTEHALTLDAREKRAVQHHRAHVASVLAERGAYDTRVLGVAFDGTGFGDDGAIWGGEFFIGSLRDGFERVAHLLPAVLPGGDAAARHPIQAAAGFLATLEALPDLAAPPFRFPERYRHACRLVRKSVRTFPTTSVGRLFDTVAALLGFTREITFEGQAAMWLEHLARTASTTSAFSMPFTGADLDFRPALRAVIEDRLAGRDAAATARAFHRGLADGIVTAIRTLLDAHSLDTVALSGGVFQNDLLLHDIADALTSTPIHVWTNRDVPPNDGGISLGQAALMLAETIAKVP
jgi:hydrogenase maturation protein HypF